jgi:hypothetical protein
MAALASTFATRRVIAVAVSLGLLAPVALGWGNPITSPAAAVISLLLTGALLVLAGTFACARDEQQLAAREPMLLILAVVTLLVLSSQYLPSPVRYGTDDAGFLHAAALALKAGHDPYSANLGWAIKSYGFQSALTLTTNGGHWTFFGYPSLSLLVTYVVILMKSGVAAATLVNVVSLAVTMALLFRALPERLRTLAPLVCLVAPLLSQQALGGVSEVMLLPTLIVVAHRWRDVGRGGTLGRDGVLRAVALGLAASTNQLVWPIIPFLLSGMVIARLPELGAREALRIVTRYASIGLAVFLVLNAGFFLWSPSSWINDILAGFTRPVTPTGQGLPINLTLFAHLGGGDLRLFSVALVLSYAALFALYVLRFDRLHFCCFMLPSVALWLCDRSMVSYFTVPAVPLLISVLNGGEPTQLAPVVSGWLGRAAHSRIAPPGVLLPAAAALAVAFTSTSPLRMRLLAAQPAKGAGTAGELTVRISNNSRGALTPHFQTDSTGAVSDFWQVQSGPRSLGAGATATYVLSTGSAQPALDQPFWLEAYTDGPETVSTVRVVPGSKN